MAPPDPSQADPRAYRRLAALIRQQIGDGTRNRAGRHRPSPASARSTDTPGRPAARRCGYWKAKGSWRVSPGSATTCNDAPATRRPVRSGWPRGGRQPCTSHVPPVHLSCTSDVPASVAAVLDGQRGRCRRRAGDRSGDRGRWFAQPQEDLAALVDHIVDGEADAAEWLCVEQDDGGPRLWPAGAKLGLPVRRDPGRAAHLEPAAAHGHVRRDQRIATRCAIKPMDIAESAAYLRHPDRLLRGGLSALGVVTGDVGHG